MSDAGVLLGYLDTPSGVSGDMLLGCLVDAGWSVADLEEIIAALDWPAGAPRAAWEIDVRRVSKGSLAATHVAVVVDEAGQPQRRLQHIEELLAGSRLPSAVVADAISVFTILARAEARVHGTRPEEVHFHEVGALDSIIDIVGVCAGLRALGPVQLHAGPLPLGSGFVASQHGQLPVPAPATLEILADAQAPSRPGPGSGELVTPTGAALLVHLVADRWHQPPMRLQRIGVGAGTRDFAWPNVARLWLGAPEATHHGHQRGSSDEPRDAPMLSLLETNIDDMNPELYAPVLDGLLELGARDAWLTPIQMKKTRPAVTLHVLADPADEDMLWRWILAETTTLGVRTHRVLRREAERRMDSVETSWGAVAVKLKLVDGHVIGASPELDACVEAARHHGVPPRQVYEAAMAASWTAFLGELGWNDVKRQVLSEPDRLRKNSD